jgi:uncharacterized protein YwgA
MLRLLGRVDGRKKFQKLVHVLQELGYPFSERFEYSYYGMYSQQLRGELDSMVADKLISEREGTNQFGSPSFSFEKTEQLDALLDEVGVGNEPEWAGAAKQLNTYSPQTLEGISTIFFLQKCGLKDEQLRLRLLSLKPHLADIYDQCLKETQAVLAFKSFPAETTVAIGTN